jgi:hypothetical protein
MMCDNNLTLTPNGDESDFYRQVADFLEAARLHAKRQMDSTIALTYYEVGRMIVEREQRGQKRAKYGAKLIKGLSEYLTEQYGRGFSVTNLKGFRSFYIVYAPSIGQMPSDLSESNQNSTNVLDKATQIGQMLSAQFKLGWSHYQILLRIADEAARSFYEVEAINQQWTVKQLQRQVGSSLYERLAFSRDKGSVMRPRGSYKTNNSRSISVNSFTGV